MSEEFMGYERPKGKVGIRNKIAILSSVSCVNHVSEEIAKKVDNAVAITHPLGCGQFGSDFFQYGINLYIHTNRVAIKFVQSTLTFLGKQKVNKKFASIGMGSVLMELDATQGRQDRGREINPLYGSSLFFHLKRAMEDTLCDGKLP